MKKIHVGAVIIISAVVLAMPRVSIAQDHVRRPGADRTAAQEAPTGFDNQSNGFLPQGPDFETLDGSNVVARRSFNDNRFIFEETEVVADGLGPVYNGQSCRECHQSVVTGGASQITEHRSGRERRGRFFESAGGSLIQSRAIHPDMVEQIPYSNGINTLRVSTNTLGNGFVEAIDDETLRAIRDAQPPGMRGNAVSVPVLESGGALRIGRFGWKSQHASLQSFAADAYLNEMGITSPFFPQENTSNGRDVGAYDRVADPEDDGEDVVAFADFMRATKAPQRGPITARVRAGEQVFNDVGCNVCHTPSITTSANPSIRSDASVDMTALANKIIHPYSDFLLHDVGTGDGIPIQPTGEFADTAEQMRTAPLWGLRTRNRLMHDGLSFTPEDAIARHGGQAAPVRAKYDDLDRARKGWLLAFLASL